MGFFGFGKKKNFIDLTENFKRQQGEIAEIPSTSETTSTTGNSFGFLGSLAGANSDSEPESQPEGYVDVSAGTEDKRKRLVKRILNMTEKLEDLTNQIYHLQQRIDVLERKAGVGGL